MRQYTVVEVAKFMNIQREFSQSIWKIVSPKTAEREGFEPSRGG